MATLLTQTALQNLGGMDLEHHVRLMGDQPRASILWLAIEELGLFKIFKNKAYVCKTITWVVQEIILRCPPVKTSHHIIPWFLYFEKNL